MNIALPALVILLGLLPGIVFYYTYFAGRFEKRRAGVSTLEEAAVYVIVAVPIHALAFRIFRAVGIDLDLSMVAYMLTGNMPDATLQQMSVRLQDHILLTTGSYMLILAMSAFGGVALRRIVWMLRIDTYVGIFRLRHTWYYVFQGRHKALPSDVLAWVYVLAEHANEKTRLYRGLVTDYDMGPDGKLESISLRGAMRGKGRGDTFTWSPIPGDLFVVLGNTIHSINVQDRRIDDSPDPRDLDQATDPTPVGEPLTATGTEQGRS